MSYEDAIVGLLCCKNDNELGAINCGHCPYDKYKDITDISACTSKLCHDALKEMEQQHETIEKQKEEIRALKDLVKKKNKKIKKLMNDNYINGGR